MTAVAPAVHVSNPELDAWMDRRAQSDSVVGNLERQVEAISNASTDAIADTRTMRVVAIPREDKAPLAEGVRIEVNGSGPRISISDAAHNQIAEKLSIPKPYYQRMLATQPGLLAVNINRWFQDEHNQHLLRMVMPFKAGMEEVLARTNTSLTLRAFLGASYRPLDNAQLLASVLPAAREAGAWLKDFNLDEQRLHARFLQMQRNTNEVSTLNEPVSMGFYLRNSETGFASLDVAAFMEILKCFNGMIGQARTQVRHVGARKAADESGDLSYLSSQTMRLDNAAIFSRVTDTVRAALDETHQLANLRGIAWAKATVIELPEKQPTFEFIGNLGKSSGLNEREIEVLQEETMRSRMEEGSFTTFSVAQGFTALARTSTGDRRAELERAGWNIITQDTAKLLAAGK
jgi:hypothetical protein